MHPPPYKACPACNRPAELHASKCAGCGRPFRTQFTPLDQTQVFSAPLQPSPKRPAPALWPMLCVFAAIVILGGLFIVSRGAPSGQHVDNTPDGPGAFTSSGPFKELPSDQEQPTIRVIDARGELAALLPASFVFTGERVYRLPIAPPEASLTVPAGPYVYELHGPQFERTGRPDQYGTFHCRKFKRYEIVLDEVPSAFNPREDLGDAAQRPFVPKPGGSIPQMRPF